MNFEVQVMKKIQPSRIHPFELGSTRATACFRRRLADETKVQTDSQNGDALTIETWWAGRPPQHARRVCSPIRRALLPLSILLICSLWLAPASAQEIKPAVTDQPAPVLAQATQPKPAATPTPSAAASPARNIRFQFDGIPYSDVIERFAQMAGKPLLAETNIAGSVTFNDPNPYTYTEALDTLNLMLSMKGQTLVESGHYLRLVPLKQLPSMPLRIMRGIDQTGDTRPSEVVTVVLDVKNVDTKDIVEAITSMLSNAGSIAPLSKGRGLIITDRLANIQRIRTLLTTIDTEAAVERQMKTYTLLHSSGAIISDLLNRTFGLATAPKRTSYNPNSKAMETLPPDPADYITAVYDDASRTLVLFGPNERIILAEELINKFEQKEGPGGDVRIYYPQTIKAEDLANVIRQAVPGVAAPGETAAAAATKARVIADASQNRLIVAAPIPGQLEQIEQLINRIDKPVHGQAGVFTNVPLRSQTIQLTKVFRPRAAEVSNLATILTQALTRRSPSGQINSTASITHDPVSQSVVVSGSPGDLQIATDIVAQLETGTTQPTPMLTRFIDVGTAAEAKRLQPLVEQLYRSQVSNGGQGPVAHAKILSDGDGGRLIVTASEDHLTRIENLVIQLRSDRGKSLSRRLEIISLKNARIETALTSIQNLVTEKMNDRRYTDAPKPSLISDPANNRLLVTATEEQITEVQQVVTVIDVAPPTARREMRVIALRAKTAAEVIAVVNPLLEQTAEQPANPQFAPKLLPDPTGRQIIALALPADFERVEKLIQQFDTSQATSAPRQFKGVELYSRSTAELTPLVTQLYTEQLRGQPEPAGGPATLLPEAKGNRIMVSGAEKEIARVEAIIRQLDPSGKKGAREETRVIRLKSALAAELAALVEKSLNAQSQQLKVLVDARSNSLVVTGDSAAVESASEVVRQLDTRPDLQPREMRIIELKQGDATSIATLANNLATELIKDQRGAEYTPQTKIVADATSNRLIVSGPKDELKTVAGVVEQLDQAPEATGGAKVFKLINADAAQIIGVVSNAMLKFDARNQPIRRVSISHDRESNSIVVSGSRADLKDAEGIIQRLDNEGIEPGATGGNVGRARELKIIPVRGDDPDALATLALRVFTAQNAGRAVTNLVSITPEPNGKRLIVLAPAGILPQVETVISTLDSAPEQGSRELHAIELKNSTTAELLPKVQQIYGEQSQGKTVKPATIYADASRARLMVYGTKEQLATIGQIVETLQSQAPVPREAKSFDFGRLAEAQRVLPLARQLYRDQVTNNPALGPADAQFISDGKTGRLIVSARANQLKAIELVVSNLLSTVATNQPGRETRTFEVGSANDVQRLQPLIQQLYTDQWKDKAENDPADAQIVADARTGRLIATGKPDHLKQIEMILQQLGAGKARQEARDTRVYDLTTASAVELATTVRTLYLEQAKARFGAQPPDTLITPDTGGNRLIVVGDTNELQAIESIVQKLDKVSAQSSTARVFKLKSAEPDKVAEILSAALVRFDAYGRPQKRASVSVDAKTRTLIVTGDPKELQGVSVIIDQLDQSLGSQPERKMKVLPLKAAKVAELTAKVRQLYNDQVKSQPTLGVGDALIMEDASSSQLILAGSDAQLSLIERIATDLQAAQANQPPRETKYFEVGSSEELTRVQPLVQQLYADQWRDRGASDPADARIIQDTKNARLIVTARPEHLKAIEKILADVNAPATSTEPRDTRVYDLNTTAAAELVITVRSLYLDQLKSRQVTAGGQAKILPDLAANRLVVSGNTNELAAVEAIITKLDQVSTKTGGARVFKLKNADAEQVGRVISTSLVQINQNGRSIPRVSVGPDTANNLIVVSGDPKDLQSAAVIIEQMDSIATKQPRQMKIVPLKSGVATDVSKRVRQLYEDQLKGTPGSGAPDALVLGDDASSRLILTASESHMKLIDDIVNKLQESGEGQGRQLRVLTLQRNSARPIATMLSQLFARQVASQDPAERLVVSASGDDRTIVVEAANKTLESIDQLVKQLDQAEGDGQSVIQTVRLKKGNATDLADAVNKSIAARTPRLQRISVTAVAGANSLLINGPTNSVDQVMKIVQELDQESTGGDIEVRIYKLENGNLKGVQGVLNQLLESVTRSLANAGGAHRELPVTVTIDDRANSLIIAATPAHFKVVEKILPTLDKAPDRSDRDVQFVWLRKAKAFEVVSKVEAVFSNRPSEERPVVEADSSNNSVTIIARRGDIAQVQDLISRLDDTSKDSNIQVRLRPLERVAAEQMARMLQSIYPQMANGQLRVVERITPPKAGQPVAPAVQPPTPQAAPQPSPAPPAEKKEDAKPTPEVVIAVDKEANSLILSGPAQELDNIDRIISDLSFSFYGNEAEFRLFPLKEADPVAVARTLSDLLKQEPVAVPQQPGQPPRTVTPQHRITVVSEPRTRSIIVRARPTDFPLIESIVKQLDAGGQTAQLEFRLVPLTNAPPGKVLPLVQQMVTQLNLARPGEPLTVTVDPRTRGLLVVARDTLLTQIEKMIHQLDSPSAYVEAEVMVVGLKKANATQLATILQNMLKPGVQGEWTIDARELQEQVRRLKVQNDQGKEVLLDLTKPIKIAADPVTGQGGGNRLVLTSTSDNLKALAAVVTMMDTVPILEDVVVKLMPLKYADAAALSQTLTTIFTQGKQLGTGPAGAGAQPDGAAGKALVNPLNVAVDARSNTLILSGQIETMNLALRVVADIDKPIDRFVTEVRLFRLKHASAIRLVPLLQSVFAEGPPVPGTEGLNTQVTRLRTVKDVAASKTTDTAKNRSALVIQADDLSNILIVAARSDTLPLIQDVIDQLDIPAASGLETVRIYPLNHADPASIQKVLSDIYTSPRATATVRNEDKPVITVDARTSALVVAGNSKSFAVIEGLLLQLDQKLPFELREIRIIPLENADANVIATTVQKLMDARVTQRASLNQGTPDTLKVTILADPRSNSLLVAGGRESFDMVESLAKQLDKAGMALSGRIRLIPVQFADARVLAATLTTLFTERYAVARTPDMQRTKPIVLADPRSNSLLVTANQEDNGVIDDLLKRLDAKTDNPALTLTVVPLKHNDASRAATLIEGIFTARMKAQTLPNQTPLPSEQIKLEPDSLNNALIISASKENLELIQVLIQKIDVEPGIEGGALQTFTLEFADAQRVAGILNSLVQQGLYRPGLIPGTPVKGTPRDALAISVDPRSNTLIVSASPENLALVKAIITKLDTKDFTASTNVRLYQLKKARASSLAATLEQFFRAKRAGDAVVANAGDRAIPVGVIPDDRVNTLLVTGSKEAFDVIENILPQLDSESVFARMNFKVFPLKKATARALQGVIQQIVANRPPKVKGEPVDPITVVADQWVNALLVGASVDDMGTVESLIERLDSEPAETGIAIHVFPLAKGDARRVAQTIQSLFRENTTGTGTAGAVLPVTVSADERINAIVVSCGENDAKRIGELVKKLDTEQVARVSEIKVFPLKYARAESLSSILNTALNTKPTPLSEQSPNAQSVLQFISHTQEGKELISAALKEAVLITPDARMNSLIVSGPVDYMGMIDQIITRLDLSSPQEAKIKVFPLQNADANQMARLLMQLFRMSQLQTAAQTGNQRSIQYTLVRSRQDEEGEPLKEEALASATLGTAEQNALTVTVDARTNSLLVGGTEHYVSLVSQVIESLDSTPANERRTEVVRLKNSQATEVALAIRTFLDQERQKVTQILGAEGIGTKEQVLEREVAVVAETASNTLLVSADPRYFEQVKALIEELDRPQAQVLIQVLLAEVTLDAMTDLGVEWSYAGKKGDVSYGIGTDFGVKDALKSFGGFSSAVSGSDFNFLLRALKNEGRLEVLSRPEIVTADNKPASINVGQRVPLITDSRVTPQNDTINSFRYEDVGINLTVTPKISPDGFVKMEISTTNSSISSSTVEINKSATVPIIAQRRATTTVSVQSGQTVVIGGLIETVDDRRVRKFPVLGEIPYLGALFRTTTTRRDRKELIILLTPQVVADSRQPEHQRPAGEGTLKYDKGARDFDKITREHLDNSGIKDGMKNDRLRKQILAPLYPSPTQPDAKGKPAPSDESNRKSP
ncbi:MAG: hypothetical protein EXS31_00360 [Pedosphaera sp.]|nr:hypothetical protein [Pedosphaera sp.]